MIFIVLQMKKLRSREAKALLVKALQLVSGRTGSKTQMALARCGEIGTLTHCW